MSEERLSAVLESAAALRVQHASERAAERSKRREATEERKWKKELEEMGTKPSPAAAEVEAEAEADIEALGVKTSEAVQAEAGAEANDITASLSSSRPRSRASRSSSPTSADPWLTEEGGYSPDSFYTQSKDPQGHSTFWRVRVSDMIAAQVGVLIQSGEVPDYRTAQDLIRDSIVHRLAYLRQMHKVGGPALSKLGHLILLEAGIERRRQVYEQVDAILEAIGNTISVAMRFRDRAEAIQMLSEAEDELRKVLTPAEYDRVLPHFKVRLGALQDKMDLVVPSEPTGGGEKEQ